MHMQLYLTRPFAVVLVLAICLVAASTLPALDARTAEGSIALKRTPESLDRLHMERAEIREVVQLGQTKRSPSDSDFDQDSADGNHFLKRTVNDERSDFDEDSTDGNHFLKRS
ncbi:hypothetical protein SCHPADRAFT_900190 [Schizopora paradoxa]|uniref:Uncharacterized protein n=1 Tax=Schizopora paradoxa TaxID=27342 RepID=A0A0H2S1R6_9AGAM|nr:hypothetical protein SCHPADRAFT_900190 [Schizopora paradoxa]